MYVYSRKEKVKILKKLDIDVTTGMKKPTWINEQLYEYS
jgi:hypothetical protein